MGELDRAELIEYFVSEAEDHLTTLSQGMSDLTSSSDDLTLIEDLFRAAHTLKGAAAIVKLNTIRNISHKMEDILEELKDRQLLLSSPVVDLLFFLLDTLKDLVQDIAQGRPERTEIEPGILSKVDEVMAQVKSAPQEVVEAASEEVTEEVEVSHTAPDILELIPSAEAPAQEERLQAWGRRRDDSEFFTGNFIKYDIRKVEEMLNLIGEVTIMKNYLLQRTKTTSEISDEIFFSGRRLIKEVDGFADRYAYSLPTNVKYVDPLLSEFGELEFDRYDELNLFSRKLQEITNDISEALKELGEFFESFEFDVKSMGNLLTLLRAEVSEMRMVDIGKLFQRFTKSVKELAAEYGKKVELSIYGGDTKIDKVIFERLFDPFMHILRNAIAHGIESPAERLEKGKSEEGLISISARREGATTVIEVSDNGRGIDRAKLFKEAVAKNILKINDHLSQEELLSLIFIPGLTTAEETDMVSGRGMGMSAVSIKISDLNGTIEVLTSNAGTTFRIKVPSSLAIVNVVVFKSGGIEFVIPTSVIEEVIPFDQFVNEESSLRTIKYRGKEVYSRSLCELFGLPEVPDLPTRLVLICNVTDKKAALIVDEIAGQEETIIKPMSMFLDGLHVYSGATISGDGKVRFVVNPARIFEEQLSPAAVRPIHAEKIETGRVLVVDDSLSVRKYASSFLESRNFIVYTASNGLEALNILTEDMVDLIITDLEMPVMHGYEFISRVKGMERLKHIPVVVLTSRSAEKHKDKAFENGAEGFLVKPFDENSMMEILRKFIMMPM